jgi:hypothetical protein
MFAPISPASLQLLVEVRPLLLALAAQMLVGVDDRAALAQYLVDLAHVQAKRHDRACDPLERKQQFRLLSGVGVRGQYRQRAVNLIALFTKLIHVARKNASLVEDLAAHHKRTSFADALAGLSVVVLVLGTYALRCNGHFL